MSTVRSLFRALARLYRRLFRRRLDARTQEVMDTLGAVPAFQHISSSSLHTMAEAIHRRSYRRGETIYHEGDPGLGLYVVEEGSVRLSMQTEPGRSRELRQLDVPETFGILAILGDFQRLETAETLTEVRVLGFFRPDLKNIVKRHPKAGAELMEALGRAVATQHVALLQHLAERQGRSASIQAHAEATAQAEG
jgi:CRP-like cAMP-binding protein